MKTSKNTFFLAVIAIMGIVIAILSIKANKKPRVITTTKTITVPVKGIISDVKISNEPIPTKVIIKDNKTIEYVKKDVPIKAGDSVQTANQYSAKVEANNATADLSILTTGRLLDVQGVINYQKEITTVETVKYRNSSGLFLYGETSAIPEFQQYRIGLDYNIKNTIIVGTSFGYDTEHDFGTVNVKFGIRIF